MRHHCRCNVVVANAHVCCIMEPCQTHQLFIAGVGVGAVVDYLVIELSILLKQLLVEFLLERSFIVQVCACDVWVSCTSAL